ncbi:hypothetical protein L596_030025 [Steinernema carpocapsae]|uniref:Uncharacterized protein n=1 Tax=Steinernema carpocapsae TaxID=34508 RepID=A0A4U5LRI5_STECR|nr:hypothetical protein L596_030025 [Steinernema carpocapsae]
MQRWIGVAFLICLAAGEETQAATASCECNCTARAIQAISEALGQYSTLLILFLTALLFYCGYQNQKRTNKAWTADPTADLSQASMDSLANGSEQWAKTHRPLFSSTPGDNSFSRRNQQGDYAFEEQSSLGQRNNGSLGQRVVGGGLGLPSPTHGFLGGASGGDHFLWSTRDSSLNASPRMRNMALR